MTHLTRHIERGSGVAIVCSHGMMMDCELFEPQIDGLSDAFRVVAYDARARGVGGEDEYDLYDLAGDFVNLLDALDIDRCFLIGMSMGGFMALRAALRYPERLCGIVLIGASAVPYSSEARAHWEAHFGSVKGTRPIEAAFARDEAEAHFSQKTHNEQPELVQRWVRRFCTRSGMATFRETLSWTRQDDVRGELPQMTMPTLIVHGDEDELVALSDAYDTFRSISGARLHVIPYASHAVNLEAPAMVKPGYAYLLLGVRRETQPQRVSTAYRVDVNEWQAGDRRRPCRSRRG